MIKIHIKLITTVVLSSLSLLLTGCLDDEQVKSVTPNVAKQPTETKSSSHPVDMQTVSEKSSYNDFVIEASSDNAHKDDIETKLHSVLPQITYTMKGLPSFAIEVNKAKWHPDSALDKPVIMKIEALLNWHNHSVGAVNGKWSMNDVKALEAFQKAQGIQGNGKMNTTTWNLLNLDTKISKRPVLVNYTLKPEDVKHRYGSMQYKSVLEALGEKFRMSRSLLVSLNKGKKFKAGTTLTVYNSGPYNKTPVSYVEVFKKSNLMVVYDKDNNIVATYPTTVGYKTPNGSHKLVSRVYKPYYNSNFANKAATKPPGPNNPVGIVWMGISKPSFGLHGSPEPEMISRQRSGGCVRLTNWDALSLYGIIQEKAKVTFINQ